MWEVVTVVFNVFKVIFQSTAPPSRTRQRHLCYSTALALGMGPECGGGSVCLDFDTPFLLVNSPKWTEGGGRSASVWGLCGALGGVVLFPVFFLYGTNQTALYVCILYNVLMSCNIF